MDNYATLTSINYKTLTESRVFLLGDWFCGLYVSSAYTTSFVSSL